MCHVQTAHVLKIVEIWKTRELERRKKYRFFGEKFKVWVFELWVCVHWVVFSEIWNKISKTISFKKAANLPTQIPTRHVLKPVKASLLVLLFYHQTLLVVGELITKPYGGYLVFLAVILRNKWSSFYCFSFPSSHRHSPTSNHVITSPARI